MKKIKTFLKDNKYLIIISIIFLFIFFLTPINGDDWGNYLVGKKGISADINHAIQMYYSWEGRFISRILISFLTYHKWLWNITNTLILVLFINCCYKFIKNKTNRIYYLIPMFLLLSVDNIFYTQCYLWVAGNITYIFPSVLSILTFYYLYKSVDKKLTLPLGILLIIISIIIPMFVENIGCAYVAGIFLMLCFYYLENKKIKIPLVLMLLSSSISLLIMLKSPGSEIRSEETIWFSQMSIFSKVFYNLPSFIEYTFNKNAIITLSILILIDKMLISKFKNLPYKIPLIVLFDIIPIITILNNIINILPLNISLKLPNLTNWYYIFYYLIFTIAWFYTIIYFIEDKKERNFLIILLLVAFISSFVMTLTPVWGSRVIALYILINILIITTISSNILTFNKPLNKIFLIIVIITILTSILYGIINKIFDIRRKNTIDNQIDNAIIYIPANYLNTLWNYNPCDDYHIQTFKEYYDISNKEIKIQNINFSEYINYLIRGEQ